jgi:hypothetical protein
MPLNLDTLMLLQCYFSHPDEWGIGLACFQKCHNPGANCPPPLPDFSAVLLLHRVMLHNGLNTLTDNGAVLNLHVAKE